MTIFKDMRSEGEFVSAEVQYGAFRVWLKTARSLSSLAGCVVRAMPEGAWAGRNWAGNRAADRMLQRARKMGVVEYRAGSWVLTEDGKKAIGP